MMCLLTPYCRPSLYTAERTGNTLADLAGHKNAVLTARLRHALRTNGTTPTTNSSTDISSSVFSNGDHQAMITSTFYRC